MIKKADAILIAVLIAVTAAFCTVRFLSSDKGGVAVVSVNGEIYGEYDINTDISKTVTTEYGSNTIVIKNGKVSVSDADCPDKYCVHHIPVKNEGDMIVCLPHRLTVEIKEGR